MTPRTIISLTAASAFLIGFSGGFFTGRSRQPAPPVVTVEPSKVSTPAQIVETCQDKKYVVVAEDGRKGLYGIAEREYKGRAYLYTLLAEVNNLKPPYTIHVGQELIVPCCLCSLPETTWKSVANVPKKPAPVSEVKPVQSPPLQEPKPAPAVEDSPVDVHIKINIGKKDEAPKPQSQNLPVLPELHPAVKEMSQWTLAFPEEIISQEESEIIPETASLIPSGTYEIQIAPEELPAISAGKFAGFLLVKKNDKWKERKKTVISVEEVEGKFSLHIPVEKDVPTESTLISFDLGQGNIVEIPGYLLHSGTTSGLQKKTKIDGKTYAWLDQAYPKNPSKAKHILGKVASIGGRAGLGFIIGGPVLAIANTGAPLVISLFNKNDKTQPEQGDGN